MHCIEALCADIIRETSDCSSEEAKTRYALLADQVGQSYPVRHHQADPDRLMRQGWGSFVNALYRSGDLEAFGHYKPCLDRFRTRFPRAFANIEDSLPWLESYRRLVVLHHLESGTPLDRVSYLDADPEVVGHVLPGESIVWQRGKVWCSGDDKPNLLAFGALVVFAASLIFFDLIPNQINPPIGGFMPVMGNWFNAIVADVIVGFMVAVVGLLHWMNVNRGALILTDRAIYYTGFFSNRHIPPRRNMRGPGQNLDPDDGTPS